MRMKEWQATFVKNVRVAQGDSVECVYHGKRRFGRVDKVLGEHFAEQLSVDTQDGFRRFNIAEIQDLVVKK